MAFSRTANWWQFFLPDRATLDDVAPSSPQTASAGQQAMTAILPPLLRALHDLIESARVRSEQEALSIQQSFHAIAEMAANNQQHVAQIRSQIIDVNNPESLVQLLMQSQ